MCGLSGFVGVRGQQTRLMLTLGLGNGIDNRGGHASGYVSISKEGLRYARKCGEWIKSRMKFVNGAARGDLCMMHARYATCGGRGANSAHPFAIARDGRVVLWGAHNGMIPKAYESAKENGRVIDVDSQEVFELLADKEYEKLQKLNGYGAITWVDAAEPDHVKFARLSRNSDFCVVSLKEGGIVWASTWKILEEALGVADLHVKDNYDVDEVGRVFEFRKDCVYMTNETGVKLASYDTSSNYRRTPSTASYEDDDDMAELIGRWNRADKESTKDSIPDTLRGRIVS